MGRGFVKGYGSILVSNGAQVYLMVVVLKGSGSDLFLRGVTQLVFVGLSLFNYIRSDWFGRG